jgi:hypothetical protein
MGFPYVKVAQTYCWTLDFANWNHILDESVGKDHILKLVVDPKIRPSLYMPTYYLAYDR